MATRLIILIVSIVAAAFASPILGAQFYGEDEVGVYITANWLAQSLMTGDWVTFLSVLVGSYHPPGRFLLATASFLLFGPSAFALRLPTVVLWAVTCVLAADIARRQAGPASGGAGQLASLVTGVLLGASGLFSLEALGFGHGVATFWGMLFIWWKVKHPTWNLVLRSARRQYLIGGIVIALGFLWFTSFLPIAGVYHLYYAYRAVRQKNIEKMRQYFLLTLPFIFFYTAYYLIFLGLPQYALRHGIRDRAVGQLHQNLARNQSAHLNVQSFIENMRGVNWYHLPFISWLLLVVGVVGQWRYSRPLFLLLTPYALLFSLYLVDNTPQHFLSYYIWLLPFAVAALWQWGKKHGRDWQGTVVCLLLAACVAAAAFGYVANRHRYTETAYPYYLEPAVWGQSKWRTNLVRPLPQIAADLSTLLGPSDLWTVTIDGALPLYYFPDLRFVTVETSERAQSNGSCLELKLPELSRTSLRAIVRSRQQLPFCSISLEKVLTYPESFLEIALISFVNPGLTR